MSRVVVTGLGIVCCLGRGKDAVWARLLAGTNKFRPVTLPGFQEFRSRIAGQVAEEDLATASSALPPRVSRHELLGWTAVQEALADAAWGTTYPLEEVGVAAGIGAAGMLEAEDWVIQRRETGGRGDVRGLYGYPVSSLSDLLAAFYGWSGLRLSIATACSSSGVALGLAADGIRKGRCRACVVVGSEALSRLTYAGFQSLRTMSPDVCRPFDRRRRGLILGEGAAALTLETYDAARARGAVMYGELLGWGLSSEAYHMTAPHPGGTGAVRAMRQAVARAGVGLEDVGYVNLHGTGTGQNDAAETLAVKTVFGPHAYRLLLSSTKAMTGHCLGAAGALESVFTLLTLHHRVAPPTVGLEEPDPACDLDYLPATPRPAPFLRFAINNVMAFGGNNVAVLFGRTDG
jgi:3-oxoacyl-[acyl-carrier-protein] synthase II